MNKYHYLQKRRELLGILAWLVIFSILCISCLLFMFGKFEYAGRYYFTSILLGILVYKTIKTLSNLYLLGKKK